MKFDVAVFDAFNYHRKIIDMRIKLSWCINPTSTFCNIRIKPHQHEIIIFIQTNSPTINNSPTKEQRSPSKTPSRAQSAMNRSRQGDYDESGGEGSGRSKSRLGMKLWFR